MQKKAFTLMEMLLVIIIIGIIVFAGRRLFALPSRYLLESEQCINTIQGNVMQFFYNSITGKQPGNMGTGSFSFVDEGYAIVYSGTNTGQTSQSIRMSQLSGTNRTMVSTTSADATTITLGNGATYLPCKSSSHTVLISGGIQSGAIRYPYRIDITKNLVPAKGRAAMSICGATGTNFSCATGTEQFTGIIEFMACKSNTCSSLHKIFIDTRSQTIKSNKCLSLIVNGTCQKRSTHEFLVTYNARYVR